MNVVLVGLDHHTAPLSLRERVAVAGYSGSLAALLDAAIATELLVIATCNRFEVYVTTRQADVEECTERIVNVLAAYAGLTQEQLRDRLFIAVGDKAARHLCEVAAGKRSMVMGETQVVAQLRRSLVEAKRAGTLGPLLHRLGNCALAASRRARGKARVRETVPAESVSSRAVDMAAMALGGSEASVVIIGAGQTAAELLPLLLSQGVASRRITICNRTSAGAQRLADRHRVARADWANRFAIIGTARVSFFCTSSTSAILTLDDALAFRDTRGTQRLLVDLGVPRNVDPGVAGIDHVSLLDIDMLGSASAGVRRTTSRESDTTKDSAEIEHWVREFETWRRRRSIVPTLSRLQANAEEIRERELQRLRQRLALGDREFEVVSAMSRRLVKQMLHRPLSTLAANPDSDELTRSARRLFDLER